MEILELINGHIKDGNTQKVLTNFVRFPLLRMTLDHAIKLVLVILQKCKDENRKSIAGDLMDIVNLHRADIDRLPFPVELLISDKITQPIAEFIVSCYPDKRAVEYLHDIVNMGPDIRALAFSKKLTKLFSADSITNEDWNYLLSVIAGEEGEYINDDLRKYYESNALETGNIIPPTCPWVRVFPKVELQIPPEFPHPSTAADMIMTRIQGEGFGFGASDEEMRDILISQYCISTLTERSQLLEGTPNRIVFSDVDIFHEYGPVNTICSGQDSGLARNHVCRKWGGCRMLLCNCFLNTDEGDDTTGKHWFTGECDKCGALIAEEHHAVRLPLESGGWEGCYCSIEHVKENIYSTEQALAVGRVQEQLDVIGIRDRN